MSNKLVKQKNDNTFIVIGTPCLNDAPIEFSDALVKGTKQLKCKYDFLYAKGALACQGRDMIVKEALEKGATHILFIDSDIIFPPDGMNRLLEHDEDIVSGLYFLKHYNKSVPVAWENLGLREDNGRAVASTITDITTPYREVDAVGFGFVLIKADVFKNVAAQFNAIFMHEYGTGEDIAFCIRAKQLGYKIMLDTTIPLIHLGSYGYSRADFERWYKGDKQ